MASVIYPLGKTDATSAKFSSCKTHLLLSGAPSPGFRSVDHEPRSGSHLKRLGLIFGCARLAQRLSNSINGHTPVAMQVFVRQAESFESISGGAAIAKNSRANLPCDACCIIPLSGFHFVHCHRVTFLSNWPDPIGPNIFSLNADKRRSNQWQVHPPLYSVTRDWALRSAEQDV